MMLTPAYGWRGTQDANSSGDGAILALPSMSCGRPALGWALRYFIMRASLWGHPLTETF